ncbi:DUF1345 domain-containing protein [Granulicoccus sp. GXG6511]|uniref:DUF1345 domain-containing protein n=1 Tax=Granulicoccus sp. GXG6511 TaxID=3381351 RepID=UPI003D7CB390
MVIANDRARSWIRLGLALGAGVAAGLFVPRVSGSAADARLLIGFVVGSLAYCLPFLVLIMGHDLERTRAYVDDLAPRSVIDVLVLIAAVASLGAVGTVLFSGGANQPRGAQVFDLAVSVAAVAAGWLLVHTAYVLRYAKHYWNEEPGSIEFGGKDEPVMSDFAYLSFCLGMTYQVSDQTMQTAAVRKIVFFHTLLSYLFGTVVIASTINMIVGLAQ